MMKDGRTMSELIREALLVYMEDRKWRRLERHETRRLRAVHNPRRRGAADGRDSVRRPPRLSSRDHRGNA